MGCDSEESFNCLGRQLRDLQPRKLSGAGHTLNLEPIVVIGERLLAPRPVGYQPTYVW